MTGDCEQEASIPADVKVAAFGALITILAGLAAGLALTTKWIVESFGAEVLKPDGTVTFAALLAALGAVGIWMFAAGGLWILFRTQFPKRWRVSSDA